MVSIKVRKDKDMGYIRGDENKTNPICAAYRAESANLTTGLEVVGSGWTLSRVEEVIGCLWLIAAVLAFGFKFNTIGWLLAIKAALDQGGAIWLAVKEAIVIREPLRAENNDGLAVRPRDTAVTRNIK